ncbi:hypothetical protein ABKW28_08895 [Nocardioides sp. 31GB23]|uniref:hypothetical protein n=1 Tax=Nocardioides sp. 31GB23 TaxID=3156065 RepID=UPI0032AFD1D9
MFKLSRVLNVLMLTLMLRMKGSAVAFIREPRKRDERGASAVEWLVILGAGIAIAYFAGDSVMAFAKNLVGQLGK